VPFSLFGELRVQVNLWHEVVAITTQVTAVIDAWQVTLILLVRVVTLRDSDLVQEVGGSESCRHW